jgi:hypothetical protein
MGGGGEGAAQRLVLRASKPKKTGTLRGQVCHSGLSEDVVYRVTLGLMCLYFKLNGPLKRVVELYFENRRHFRRIKQNLTSRNKQSNKLFWKPSAQQTKSFYLIL